MRFRHVQAGHSRAGQGKAGAGPGARAGHDIDKTQTARPACFPVFQARRFFLVPPLLNCELAGVKVAGMWRMSVRGPRDVERH